MCNVCNSRNSFMYRPNFAFLIFHPGCGSLYNVFRRYVCSLCTYWRFRLEFVCIGLCVCSCRVCVYMYSTNFTINTITYRCARRIT